MALLLCDVNETENPDGELGTLIYDIYRHLNLAHVLIYNSLDPRLEREASFVKKATGHPNEECKLIEPMGLVKDETEKEQLCAAGPEQRDLVFSWLAGHYNQLHRAGEIDKHCKSQLVLAREKQIGGPGGSLEPPGPLLTHLHTIYMAYSECLPTRLNSLAERACFSQVLALDELRALVSGLLFTLNDHAPLTTVGMMMILVRALLLMAALGFPNKLNAAADHAADPLDDPSHCGAHTWIWPSMATGILSTFFFGLTGVTKMVLDPFDGVSIHAL